MTLAFSNILNWYIKPELYSEPIMTKITYGRFTFFFGLLTFLLTITILLKIYKYDLSSSLNSLIPSILLFHAIGRIGCMLGGCCYGKIVNLSFFSFSIERFPVREIEFLFLVTLFLLFQFIIKENRLIIYLAFYSLFRFVIEYYRGDNRGVMFSNMIFKKNVLSPSQEISIIILFTLLLYVVIKKIIMIKNR